MKKYFQKIEKKVFLNGPLALESLSIESLLPMVSVANAGMAPTLNPCPRVFCTEIIALGSVSIESLLPMWAWFLVYLYIL